MNILMLSTDMRIFEADSAVSKRLSKYGVLGESVTFVVFGPGERRERELAPHVLAVTAGGGGKLSAFCAGFFELWKRSKGADIISSQDPFFLGAAALKVAWLRRVPLQIQLHTDCFSSSYADESLRRHIEAFLASFVVRHASCVRAVSERVAKSVRRITKKPVSVLPVFVPQPETVQRAVHAGFTALTVSRLTPEKRVDLIIRALADVKDARLIIVGEGPLKPGLEALARTLGIANRVEFAGWQTPDPFYASASVYVQASRYEGYGMSLVEAALRGLPIVATDAGIVGEVFRNGEEMLIASGTAGSLAEEIKRIQFEPAFAARLGEAARKKAEALIVSEDDYLARYASALKTCF